MVETTSIELSYGPLTLQQCLAGSRVRQHGVCIPIILSAFGSQTLLPGHRDLSSYTPCNREVLPRDIPSHLVLAVLG